MSQDIHSGACRVEVAGEILKSQFPGSTLRSRMTSGLSWAVGLFGLHPIYRQINHHKERQDVYLERFPRERTTGLF